MVLLEYMEQQVSPLFNSRKTLVTVPIKQSSLNTAAGVHGAAGGCSNQSAVVFVNTAPNGFVRDVLNCPRLVSPRIVSPLHSPLHPLQPPLLNRPGMGARLITYYRKKEAADTGHLELKKGVFCNPAWRPGS